MIYEWRESGYRNLGDAFTELIAESIEPQHLDEMRNSKKDVHFLVGSHIYNETISFFAKRGYMLHFYACGWRGEEIDPGLLSFCNFYGVRGPKTKSALERAGAKSDIEVKGDPAYGLLNKLNIPKASHQDIVLMPHVVDEGWWFYDVEGIGADRLEEAKVQTKEDVINKIKLISGAKFILSGSMHACMVADYYGVPFAPFGGKWIDCPPKWEDWMESRGYNSTHLNFSTSVEEGKEWYARVIAPRRYSN